MKIQINSDHTISENERMDTSFKTLIGDSLKYYSEHITRIEVHFSDENGNKDGLNDKRCMIEARLEGKQPTAVTAQADTIEEALNSGIEKMVALLKTELGKMNNHHKPQEYTKQ
jgi:hypothetical protein